MMAPNEPNAGATHDESGLLAACPRCGYSLRGLPIEHRCPECGLPVDRRWQIVAPDLRPRSSVRTWVFAILAALFLLGSVLALGIRFLRLPWTWSCGSIAHSLSALAVTTILGRHLFRLYKGPPGFLAISPDNLVVFTGTEPADVYPRDEIRELHLDSQSTLHIVLHNQTVRVPGQCFLRGTAREINNCMRLVMTFRAGQVDAGEPDSGPDQKRGPT